MTTQDELRANSRILCNEYSCLARGNLMERCRLDNYKFCPRYTKDSLDIHLLSDKLEEQNVGLAG